MPANAVTWCAEKRDPNLFYTGDARHGERAEWKFGAALRSLGRNGLAELGSRENATATRWFAEGLKAAGHEILNDGSAESGARFIWKQRNVFKQ